MYHGVWGYASKHEPFGFNVKGGESLKLDYVFEKCLVVVRFAAILVSMTAKDQVSTAT